ncbi:MAG: NAD-dependent epimerase/dehydratase family protein [Robiginitomaculum sp.]|nr:NAD-dependent epimerase/dehydratase family protein [Robiginitomaculum sp.]
MKVFITGGCGQIGSHIAEILLARGDEVMAIDNFETGRREHLPESHDNLTLITGSIADKPLVDKLIGEFRPDVLIHTAASYKDPDNWYEDNITNCVGGGNLVQAAKEFGVGRFIYYQTALCYGTNPSESPVTLDHPKNPGNSSYSISKTAAEDYLELSGINFVTFRLANVVGPRNVSGPLPIFYSRLKSGKKCFVTEARRDFVFVGDLAKASVAAADGTGNGAYHFSSGTDIAIIELYDAVVKALKINDYPAPDVHPLGEDDAASILLDPSRTYKDFGAIDFTPLDTFVALAVEYYNEHGTLGEYTHLKLKDDKET